MILPPLLHRGDTDKKSDSYKQGRMARYHNVALKDNPYVPAEGEYDYAAWMLGWYDMEIKLDKDDALC